MPPTSISTSDSEGVKIAKIHGPGSDAAAIISAGEKIGAQGAKVFTFNDMPVAVVKDGYSLAVRTELMPPSNPLRASGTQTLNDLASFCELFKKYKNSDSVILVNSDQEGKRGAEFVGILNYHGISLPGYCDYIVRYTSRLSVEWARWMSKNGVLLNHAAFLEHLEDVRDLITEPDGAGLLDLISSLEGRVNARFENALNLHNGRMKLSYAEDVELKQGQPVGTRKGDMEVPTEIIAGIAPFEFGQPYVVKNRLRYRIQNRTLCFAYEVVAAHNIIADAVKDQVNLVSEKTGTLPLYGVPPTK